jgi:hypothetical protein
VDPPEAAVGVLRNVLRMVEPSSVLLHLTCRPPSAAIESAGGIVGRLDQSPFLERVARTEEAVERLIGEGLLAEEASLAHDVLKHFESVAQLAADIDERRFSSIPPELARALAGVTGPVVERSACVMRRLRATGG